MHPCKLAFPHARFRFCSARSSVYPKKTLVAVSVVLRLTIPALILVILFSFMLYWNGFLGPLIYLNSEAKHTLSVGLQLFQGRYNAQWHLMMAAAATVVIAPAVIVFLVGPEYFVEGITLT